MKGFFCIYKPSGISSFGVIAALRKKLKVKQIGHAGTLDPMAEGVLPIAIGKMTRMLEYLEEGKEYICECEFGKISNTYDLEGEVKIFSNKKTAAAQVDQALQNFIGEIEQTPPAFSAIHYNGKRLYEFARKGEIPDDIPKRQVQINFCKLLNFDETTQKATFKVSCSKGTYIRSIVHDLGQKLNVGAVMTKLIRTKSGQFCVEASVTLEAIMESATPSSFFLNPFDVLNYKKITLSENEFSKIRHGQPLKSANEVASGEIFLLEYKDELVAAGTFEGGLLKTKKVLV